MTDPSPEHPDALDSSVLARVQTIAFEQGLGSRQLVDLEKAASIAKAVADVMGDESQTQLWAAPGPDMQTRRTMDEIVAAELCSRLTADELKLQADKDRKKGSDDSYVFGLDCTSSRQ